MSPNNNFFLFLAIFNLLFVTGCSGQSGNKSTDPIDALLNQERKNQDNAKYGNKNPDITVISDSQRVEAMRHEIEKKIRLQEKTNKEKNKKKSPVEAYKGGDKTAVPAIVQILKGNNKIKKQEVLGELCKNFDDGGYSIKEHEIIDLVLRDIDDPVYEKDAVQLAGLNELPGFDRKFEARLLTGRSTDEGRIFFWLGKKATSDKALAYFARKVKENKVAPIELNGIIGGLEGYAENGSPELKTQVGQMALDIYRKKFIPDNDFEELKQSTYTSNSAEGLLTCLFECGDKDVIPIANDILARGIRVTGPVKALLRLEGDRHLEKVYQLLRSEDNFFTGLDLVESIERKYVDDKMLKEVLVQFGKRKEIEDYQVQRIVITFVTLKAEDYIKNSADITDGKVAERLKKYFALNQISTDLVIADLKSKGLITKSPDSATIGRVKKESSNNQGAFIYSLLELQNITLYFDAETDFLPVNYDELLKGFAKKSEGLLSNMVVWMDVKEDKAKQKFSYVITVIYKDHAFIVKPEDVGDWYDVMTVNALLDKMLELSGSPKRFNSLETGDQTVRYIFGVPGVVKEIVKKYEI
ncbi:hypothetical protein A3860_32335 [Niastella vici]|uniref:Uncharacterized protein n=1 Tax=Niastella vici TaxID=1703345 RepID=A0A1V9FQS3_9BACT|nr:hypothetical protein [Niastella vici]OQP60690.1 hypothetical protein A3860_32335 [Niastella vici]